jgi:hypothetical protein
LRIRSRIGHLAQAALPVRASRRRIVNEIRFLRRNRGKRLVRPRPRAGELCDWDITQFLGFDAYAIRKVRRNADRTPVGCPALSLEDKRENDVKTAPGPLRVTSSK